MLCLNAGKSEGCSHEPDVSRAFNHPLWDFFLLPKANRHSMIHLSSFLLYHPWHWHLYGTKISFCKTQLGYVWDLQKQL